MNRLETGLSSGSIPGGPGGAPELSNLSIEHYLLILWHRKWLVVSIFLLIAVATAAVTHELPNIYTADTLILVDPQKVPEDYVRATVTGDVRNRLNTLSQQILSTTRLQKVIDTFDLYQEERKTMAREDVISQMRSDISVSVVSDLGSSQSQDLQAFKIGYSGRDPRLVAQVTNELASLFIEENSKAREEQATETSAFLENQLEETRKELEAEEDKLRDFKLKHIGEMPEQESTTLGIYEQLQSQYNTESNAIDHAEEQKTYLQTMMAQGSAPVADMDPIEAEGPPRPAAGASSMATLEGRLAALRSRYGDKYPDVLRLESQIADQKAAEAAAQAAAPRPAPASSAPVAVPEKVINPVLMSQISDADAEITKHKQALQRLSEQIAAYKSKLEAVPVNEQETTALERDYDIAKAHYSALLEKKLSADTAEQLEIRQEGQRFTILDPAQVPEKPSKPPRMLLNLGGALAGLILGLAAAFTSEIFGMSIASIAQINPGLGGPVLGSVPIIRTRLDDKRRKKWVIAGAASGLAGVLAVSVFLVLHYRFFN